MISNERKEVAIVVQRYGKDITGGAEQHARFIAEKLASELDWKVNVFTTTAKDYLSWQPFYKPGIETLNGVLIHRFDCSRTRSRREFRYGGGILLFFAQTLGKIPGCGRLVEKVEAAWLYLQGPVCPNLIETLRTQAKFFSKIFFFTYLYYPTVYGLPVCSEKSVLIPTAHDEPAFYFRTIKKVFKGASAIFANTEAERQLIRRVHGDFDVNVVGVGIDLPGKMTFPIKSLPGGPYVLYLGRIGSGKNLDDLIRNFLYFCEANGNTTIRLVLAGKCDEGFKIPYHSQIEFLGFVSENKKNELLRDACCLVNPSSMESLSMIVLESLAFGTPALVNIQSEVLKEYADQIDCVFGFDDQESFGNNLRKISELDWKQKHHEQLKAGQDWVSKNYSWKKILTAYSQLTS